MLERGSCLQSLGEMNTSGTGQEDIPFLPAFAVPRHEKAQSNTKAAEITSFLACLVAKK